jgi:hypothetical protein
MSLLMKGNLYYHFYYLLTKFSKWVNKRNSEFAFSGMAYLSICMAFNIITLLFALEFWRHFNAHLLKWHIVLSLAVIGLNYLLLMHNGKYKKIISHYDAIYNQKKSQSVKVILALYIIVSNGLCFYLAYLVRNK